MRFAAEKKPVTLSFLIKILLVGVVASAGYVVYSVFYGEGYYLGEKDFIVPGAGDDFLSAIDIEEEDYNAFFRQLEKREVFVLPSKEEEEEPPPAVDPGKARRLIETLRLVGIKSGDSPRVIIESRKQAKTFYLKEGDVFLEDIKIEAIYRDSVILNCYGETFEIYL